MSNPIEKLEEELNRLLARNFGLGADKQIAELKQAFAHLLREPELLEEFLKYHRLKEKNEGLVIEDTFPPEFNVWLASKLEGEKK